MSRTQQRLDAYYAAETRILAEGQSLGGLGRQSQEAELAEIRKAIAALELKLAGEVPGARGGSLRHRTVVFDGPR